MFRFCVLLTIFGIITCTPVTPEKSVINKYENNNDGSGNYRFSFDTSDNTSREETGHIVNKGQSNEHIVVEGYYMYVDTDGKLVKVNYSADENGFHILPNVKVAQQEQVTVNRIAYDSNIVASLLG